MNPIALRLHELGLQLEGTGHDEIVMALGIAEREILRMEELLAHPEPPSIIFNEQGIIFNEKGEAFIPGISEEDEAIVNAILSRRAGNDRMKRPEPEPRITRGEAHGVARPEPQTQTLYVFLQQRPCDKQSWPLVYVDRQLAEAAPHRVTPVVAVDVPLPSLPDAEATR